MEREKQDGRRRNVKEIMQKRNKGQQKRKEKMD